MDAGLGAALGAAGGLLGSIFSSNQASKNRKFQAEENRLQREFNSQEAQKSRDFQLEMFNRTNEYNTPQNTVNRLLEAGLHPALAFGGIQGASFGGSAAQASSSAAGSGAMPDYSGLSSAGQAAIAASNQSELTEAQIDLLKSEADKNRKDISWIDRLNSAKEQHELSGVLVDISTKDLNEEQAKTLVEQRDQIKATIDNLKSNTDFMNTNKELLAKEVSWYDIKQSQDLYESLARVQELFSKADLNKTEAYRLSVLLSSEVFKNEATGNFMNASAMESGQRRGLYAFDNALNESKRKQYGLDKLTEQQWREIESVIRNHDADSSYKIGSMINDGVKNIFDVTKDGFELYQMTRGRKPVRFM